jgi:hypothetical protein
MSTNFKYAERDLNKAVNWEEVGKNISGRLLEEQKSRDEQKAAIDAQIREDARVLADTPQGQNESLNSWSLKYASQAQEKALLLERLLKKGIMKPKDYAIYRQNLADGTNQAFTLVKDANKIYDEGLKRANAGDSSLLEQWNLAQFEIFGNLNKSELYVNPDDFTVGVMAKDEKGNLKGKDSVRSIAALKGMLNKKVNRYDVEGVLKKSADTVATFVNASENLRGLKSIEDIRQHKEYQSMEDNIINSLIVNKDNAGSILVDYAKFSPSGKLYEITSDPNVAKSGDNYILMVKDPVNPTSGQYVPELSPAQEKQVKEALRTRLRSMLDHKEEAQQKFAPIPQQQWQAARGDKVKEDKDVATWLGKLYFGDDTEINAATEYFKGLNQKILNIDRVADGVKVTYDDGKSTIVKFKDASGKVMTLTDWMGSATELTGEADVKTAIKNGAVDLTRPFNPTGTGAASRTQSATTKAVAAKPFMKASIISTDDKGKQTVIPVSTKLNEIDFGGPGTYDETVAASIASKAQEIFGSLPSEYLSDMTITSYDSGEHKLGKDAITILYIPSLMEVPVAIPITETSGMESATKRIIQQVYDAASSGKKITQDALKKISETGTFDKYNNVSMYELVNMNAGKKSASDF